MPPATCDVTTRTPAPPARREGVNGRRLGTADRSAGPEVCAAILRAVGSASTPHALRHFYATSVLASTQNLRLTQVLMRHAYPSTTARYAAVADWDAVAAVQGLRRVG